MLVGVERPTGVPDVNLNGASSVVARPIRPAASVNHIAPSGPTAIPNGPEAGEMPLPKSCADSLRRTWPMRLPLASVNHIRPSGPATMSSGKLPGVGGEVRPPRLSSGARKLSWLAFGLVSHSSPSCDAAMLSPLVNGCSTAAAVW